MLVNSSNSLNPIHPEPHSTEVVAKAKRRRFTAEYKQKTLREAEACTKPGAIGALLRREGLYSSHLVEWRKLRDRGELAGLEPKKRGPKVREPNPLAKKLAEQERKLARLEAENAKLRLICEVQKKVSLILGVTLPPIPDDDEPSGSRS